MLSIIIVNYKTPDLTFRCLESLYQAIKDVSFEVIIVDNNSQDDSKQKILQQFENVIWIQNSYNAGFGRANNVGVKQAKGEYILLLNSDILLLENQKLEDCIQLFENNPDIGVVGCELLNEDGSVQKSTYYDVATIRYLLSYNILWYKLFKPNPKSLDAVMGSFMMFRKRDFDVLRGFDEDFFMYAEELELCHRLKKINKEIIFFDAYTAIHKHGGSSTGSNWSERQNMLSTALLYFKVRGFFGYLLYHCIFFVNILTNMLFRYTLTAEMKKSYGKIYTSYFYSFWSYFKIPFYFFLIKREKRTFLKINN